MDESTSYQSTIPVTNRFNQLNGLDDDITESPTINESIKINKSRIPPIVVKNLNIQDINNIMKQLEIEQYNIKFQSIGIKLFVYRKEHLNTVIQHLTEKNVHFFTYDSDESKPIKILCSGLPRFDIQFIKTDITQQNELIGNSIIDIKCFEIKHKKFDNETNFVMYFKKGAVKINDVRKIKSIGNVLVRWNYYVNKRSNPTQCRRCQLYGHGTRNCNLNPKCNFCSLNHMSQDCELLNQKDESIYHSSVKCANCGENHRANDPACLEKKKFIEIRQKLQENRNKKQNKNNPVSAGYNSSRNYASNFPQLKVASQTIPYKTTSTATIHQPNSNWATTSQQQTAAFSNPDLFTFEEISSLINEALHKLSCCKTKEQQFQTIMELTTKYLYNQHGQ